MPTSRAAYRIVALSYSKQWSKLCKPKKQADACSFFYGDPSNDAIGAIAVMSVKVKLKLS